MQMHSRCRSQEAQQMTSNINVSARKGEVVVVAAAAAVGRQSYASQYARRVP